MTGWKSLSLSNRSARVICAALSIMAGFCCEPAFAKAPAMSADESISSISSDIRYFVAKIRRLERLLAHVSVTVSDLQNTEGRMGAALADLQKIGGSPSELPVACGMALQLRATVSEMCADSEQEEKRVEKALQDAEALAGTCTTGADAAKIRSAYTVAVRALTDVSKNKAAATRANDAALAITILFRRAAESDEKAPGAIDCSPAFKSIAELRRMFDYSDPIVELDNIQRFLATITDGYALTDAQKSEIGRLQAELASSKAHPFSYYDPSSLEKDLMRLCPERERMDQELRAWVASANCPVTPADEAVACIDSIFSLLGLQVAGYRHLPDAANRCEMKAALKRELCEVAAAALQDAIAEGRQADEQRLRQEMQEAGCDAIAAGPAPPARPAPEPPPGRPWEEGGLPGIAGVLEGRPESSAGGVPPSPSAGPRPADGEGPTAELPPSLEPSTAAGPYIGPTDALPPSLVSGTQREGSWSEGAPSSQLPPSLAGQAAEPGAPTGSGGVGGVIVRTSPGYGMATGGVPGPTRSTTQPPFVRTGASAAPGPGRTPQGSGAAPPSGPRPGPAAKPPSGTAASTASQPTVAPPPNGCAPPGKRWPSSITINHEGERPMTVQLDIDHPLYSYYRGRDPSGRDIALQLNIFQTSVVMAVMRADEPAVLAAKGNVPAAGNVPVPKPLRNYTGTCKGNMVEGMYGVTGSKGNGTFKAAWAW